VLQPTTMTARCHQSPDIIGPTVGTVILSHAFSRYAAPSIAAEASGISQCFEGSRFETHDRGWPYCKKGRLKGRWRSFEYRLNRLLATIMVIRFGRLNEWGEKVASSAKGNALMLIERPVASVQAVAVLAG